MNSTTLAALCVKLRWVHLACPVILFGLSMTFMAMFYPLVT